VFTQLTRGSIAYTWIPTVVRVSPSVAVWDRARKSRLGHNVVLFHIFSWARSMCVKKHVILGGGVQSRPLVQNVKHNHLPAFLV